MPRRAPETPAEEAQREALEQTLLGQVVGVSGHMACEAMFNAFCLMLIAVVEDREEFDDVAARLEGQLQDIADDTWTDVRSQHVVGPVQ